MKTINEDHQSTAARTLTKNNKNSKKRKKYETDMKKNKENPDGQVNTPLGKIIKALIDGDTEHATAKRGYTRSFQGFLGIVV